MVAVSYYWNIWQMHELERSDVTTARINPEPEMKGRNWYNKAYWEYLNVKFNEMERCFSRVKWISQKHLSNCRLLNIKSYVTALKMDSVFYLENLPIIHYFNKVNRCLARYSPRATTTNRPTNRAMNKPAWPGPNWPKMPVLGQIWSFLGKKSFFLLEKSKVLLPT